MALFELPLQNDTSRKIIHLDMDAFYASIEMRDNPQLRSKALVIARDPRTTGGKGVVTTANYVARRYGVHSAMPANEALQLVPRSKLVFKTPDFPKYKAVSAQIHALFHQVTDLIEPVAFDLSPSKPLITINRLVVHWFCQNKPYYFWIGCRSSSFAGLVRKRCRS